MKNKRIFAIVAIFCIITAVSFGGCSLLNGNNSDESEKASAYDGTYYYYSALGYKSEFWIKLYQGEWLNSLSQGGNYSVKNGEIVLKTEFAGEAEKYASGTVGNGVLSVGADVWVEGADGYMFDMYSENYLGSEKITKVYLLDSVYVNPVSENGGLTAQQKTDVCNALQEYAEGCGINDVSVSMKERLGAEYACVSVKCYEDYNVGKAAKYLEQAVGAFDMKIIGFDDMKTYATQDDVINVTDEDIVISAEAVEKIRGVEERQKMSVYYDGKIACFFYSDSEQLKEGIVDFPEERIFQMGLKYKMSRMGIRLEILK